jgi:hypothetical protein
MLSPAESASGTSLPVEALQGEKSVPQRIHLLVEGLRGEGDVVQRRVFYRLDDVRHIFAKRRDMNGLRHVTCQEIVAEKFSNVFAHFFAPFWVFSRSAPAQPAADQFGLGQQSAQFGFVHLQQLPDRRAEDGVDGIFLGAWIRHWRLPPLRRLRHRTTAHRHL